MLLFVSMSLKLLVNVALSMSVCLIKYDRLCKSGVSMFVKTQSVNVLENCLYDYVNVFESSAWSDKCNQFSVSVSAKCYVCLNSKILITITALVCLLPAHYNISGYMNSCIYTSSVVCQYVCMNTNQWISICVAVSSYMKTKSRMLPSSVYNFL